MAALSSLPESLNSFTSGDSESAQARIKIVDQSLSCPVCLERFRDPRLLTCNHSFCRVCLEDIVKRRRIDPEHPVGDEELHCPKCRIVTRLPHSGVFYLPINYALKEVAEALEDEITSSPPSSMGHHHPSRQQSVAPNCELHDKPLEYFCKTDDKLLCGDCLVEETHKGHDFAKANKVLEEELEMLRENSFELAERMLLKMTVAVDDVRNMTEAVKEKGERTKHQIQQHFQEVKKVLRQREQALLETTEQIVMMKTAALNKQKEKLEHSKSELETHVERLKVVLSNTEDVTLLAKKKQLATEVSRVVDRAQLNDRTPVESTKDGPDWHLPPDLLSNAMSFGEVFCKPCPSKFTAVGEGLKKAFVGLEARFTVEARDRYGQRSYISGTRVNVMIKGSDELSEVGLQVSERDKGEYLVTYIPTEIGYHTITVTADDKRISSDQFHVVVFKSKDYLALGQPQSVITKQQIRCEPSVSTMRGIATLPSGDIIFTDAFCLRVINPTTGQLIRTIGCYGNAPGEFTLPLGLAVNQQGNIFVSDSTNNRIQKFSSSGRFQLVFGVQGRGGGLSSPEGISLLGEDKVYVADQGNNRIQVFSQKNGRHSNSFGRKGREPGQFMEPRDVAVDSKNHCVLISDTGNARIQALSLDGKPLLHFGTRGSVRLSFPYFLAVDENGFIVVTETKTQMVTILTPQGSFVRYLGPPVGDAPGYFRTPYGVTISNKGLIMVTDSTIPSVLIF